MGTLLTIKGNVWIVNNPYLSKMAAVYAEKNIQHKLVVYLQSDFHYRLHFFTI